MQDGKNTKFPLNDLTEIEEKIACHFDIIAGLRQQLDNTESTSNLPQELINVTI